MQQKHSKIKLISITPVQETNTQANPQYSQFSQTQEYYQHNQNQYPYQTYQFSNNQQTPPYSSFQGPFIQQDPYTMNATENFQQIQISESQIQEKVEFVQIPNCDIFSRYYNFKKVEYLQPVIEQTQKEIYSQDQQDDEIPNELEPVADSKRKKKRKQKNKKQKQVYEQKSIIEQQENNLNDSIQVIPEISETVQSIAQEFDDAVNDNFLKVIDKYMKIEQQNYNLTQSIYGKQKKQIIIQEIIGLNEMVASLCQEFPQIKFSEITMAAKLLVTYEKCRNFLIEYNPQKQQRVLRQINQLIQEEQLAKTQNNQNELLKTQVRIGELQQALKPSVQLEDTSLLSTAYHIIEKKKYNANSCKNDQKLIQQKKNEFSQNRTDLIACYNQKADLVRQFQQNQLTQEAFERKLQGNKSRKLKLQEKGKELFLQLMVIEKDSCRVDFHKLFAAEIEDLLDGILDQIESYKIYSRSDRVRLQIIVGKGKHSIGGKPIIGPITQQYLRRELEQNVEIREGIINVLV